MIIRRGYYYKIYVYVHQVLVATASVLRDLKTEYGQIIIYNNLLLLFVSVFKFIFSSFPNKQ